MLIVAFFLIWFIPIWQVKNLKEIKKDKNHSVFELEKEKIKLRDDTRKTLAQIIGGTFFVFSLFVAYNTFQLNRENQFDAKYIEAVKLIGSDHSSQRLGGLLALEDILNNSYNDYSKIMNFLTNFLQQKSKEIKTLHEIGTIPNSNTNTKIVRITNNGNQTNNAAQNSNDERVITDKAKVNLLRDEISISIKIIKCRNKLNEPNDFVLHLENLELVNADLENADFSKANFQGANLTGAKFSKTDISETDFSNAILQNTIFEEDTIFFKTKMENADLSGSNINIEQLFNVIINEQTILPEAHKDRREDLLANSKKLAIPVETSPVQKNWKDLLKMPSNQPSTPVPGNQKEMLKKP